MDQNAGKQDATDKAASNEMASNNIVLGSINGVFGVQGWVKVFSETEPRENIVSYQTWTLRHKGITQSVRVAEGRRQGKNIVARLAGVTDRDAAALLIGSEISVARDQLPELDADEYYWADLIGFAVFDLDGEFFGTVERLFETGANDVLVVRAVADGDPAAGKYSGSKYAGGEILIPWIRESVITEVDSANRRINVDWDPDY